jgi:hypothetical protein
MNRNPQARLCSIAFLVATVAALQVSKSQDSTHTTETIPLIPMQSVTLTDVIKKLARQTGQNFILDLRLGGPSRLGGPWLGLDGRPAPEPSVTVRWENLTAEQLLGKLLKKHGLTIIANPATSIARIAFTNQAVKPIPASQVGDGSNAVIPLVVMDCVPLDEAIKNFAAQAHLNLSLDPALPVSSAGPVTHTVAECFVSVRWEKVTARQALAALLDNYGLALFLDPVTSSAKILAKAQTEGAMPPKQR